MRTNEINRAQFLTRAGAVGAAIATGSLLTACQDDDNDDADASPTGPPRRLKYRGVCYQTVAGEFPETDWTATRMRADLRVIKDELHADSVLVYGTGLDRLAPTASEAAERGLHLWLQPRMGDRPQQEILDHLAAAGEHAEELRRQGAEIELSVGCEYILFVPGIMPGAHVLERIENIQSGNFDREQVARRMADFVERAAATGRSVFQGQLTYSAAHGDEVDWDLFDIVSVDYYTYHGTDRAAYAKDLARYYRWDKPVAITEFGSCAYVGAPERGGMAWDVVDYSQAQPQIEDGVVRSESAQARYLADTLGVFESMDLYAAMVHQFVAPDSPHRPDRRHDQDLSSYGLVKAIWEHPDTPGDWHWERKQAFYTVAEQFAKARR